MDEGLSAAPGVAVGVLLIVAAIMWFSPGARHKFRKATLWLVVAAVALIILVGYLGIGREQ
jgi:ABC-type nickel/cobalt efflux system permease component RcnA